MSHGVTPNRSESYLTTTAGSPATAAGQYWTDGSLTSGSSPRTFWSYASRQIAYGRPSPAWALISSRRFFPSTTEGGGAWWKQNERDGSGGAVPDLLGRLADAPIQLCVRNPDSILRYFRPIPERLGGLS